MDYQYIFGSALLVMSGTANAAHVSVFAPTVDVNASVTGPSASIRIINGNVVDSTAAPGTSVSAGPQMPGATSVWAEARGAYSDPDKSWTIATGGQSSLDSGWLKGSVAASGDTSFGYPRGQLTDRLSDTVWFTNTSGAPVQLTLSLAYDGRILNPHGEGAPGGSVALQLYGSCGNGCGNAQGEYLRFATGPNNYASGFLRAYFNQGGSYGYNDLGSPVPPGQSDNWFIAREPADGVDGYVEGLLRATIVIPTGETSLGISADLQLDCASGSSCLFGNTSTFRFGALPAGLSWTSQSGKFLAAVAAPGVPEPASWAMMICGFGLAGAMARRRTCGAAA